MTNDPFKGMRPIGDSAHPKATAPAATVTFTKSFNPKPANPGATVQPKAPLAPTETSSGQKPPPAKND
jgi:hypothetical protein